jgi:hypothetical protein
MNNLTRLAAASAMFMLIAPLPTHSQTQDANSLSSQGFSLRVNSSRQVTILNSTLIVLPANITSSQFQEVLMPLILHKPVDEIKRAARGADITVFLAKEASLEFPKTTRSAAKFILSFDFVPDPLKKECRDYRIDMLSSVPDESRTFSNPHPNDKGKCMFIASFGMLKPILFSSDGLTNVLFRLHAISESLIQKERASESIPESLQVLEGEIRIPAEATLEKGFVRLVLPSKDSNPSTIPFRFLGGSSDLDVDLNGNFLKTSPLQPTTYLEANVVPNGHFAFRGVRPGNYQMIIFLIVSSKGKDCSSQTSKHYDIWDLDPNPNTHRNALTSFECGLSPDGTKHAIWSYFIKPLTVNSDTKTAGSFKLTRDLP